MCAHIPGSGSDVGMGLLPHAHPACVLLQRARLRNQASIRAVQSDKSCGTFGNDSVSGIVISSAGAGGICAGGTTTGEGGIEALAAREVVLLAGP